MTQAGMNTEHRKGATWLGMYLAVVAVIIGLQTSGAINHTTGFILFVCAMGMMIPASRAFIRSRRTSAQGRAIARYSKGMLVAGFGYALGLGAAIMLNQRFEIAGFGAFALAMLPVLPIFYMIFVMGRYLSEEPDEYLRHRTTIASLVGLAFLLGFGAFWGFLEQFALAPHLPGWWALPVWAGTMGLAQAFLAFRDRRWSEG